MVTNLIGEEWGPTGFTNLIAERDAVDILLYDIDADWSVAAGKTVGYFWAKDNFTASDVSNSNERIMFYMDAPFLHYTEAFWADAKGVLISTLAHELQHMISFYQRWVRGGQLDGTWMEEMMSLMVEDLVADAIAVEPPVYRLDTFNAYPEESLTNWPGRGSDSLDFGKAYATSYAYGAYLLRNYGGADFLAALYAADAADSEAVSAAIAAQSGGSGPDFAGSLVDWAIAALASSRGALSASPFSYGAYSGSLGTVSYNLSAIDLGAIPQFFGEGSLGPGGVFVFSDSDRIPVDLGENIPPNSNVFFRAASGADGTVTVPVIFPPGLSVTVVVQ